MELHALSTGSQKTTHPCDILWLPCLKPLQVTGKKPPDCSVLCSGRRWWSMGAVIKKWPNISWLWHKCLEMTSPKSRSSGTLLSLLAAAGGWPPQSSLACDCITPPLPLSACACLLCDSLLPMPPSMTSCPHLNLILRYAGRPSPKKATCKVPGVRTAAYVHRGII
jgi:hypothetical protein